MNAPARFPADPRRRAMIAKVKIAQKELRLDDSAYRAMLLRLTRKESAADCTEAELGLVLDELKAKGWSPLAANTAGKPKPRLADHPAAKKARALWISLWNLGEVRDAGEHALEAFAKRQLGVERLQWADQGETFKLIEALKAMAERAGWSQDLAGIKPRWQVLTLKQRLVVAQFAKLRGLGADDLTGLEPPVERLDEIIAINGRHIRLRQAPEAAA